jgi:hypothetical protein
MKSNTHNFWGSGLFPSIGILKSRRHNVSKMDLLPSSGEGRKTPTLLGPLERAFSRPQRLLRPRRTLRHGTWRRHPFDLGYEQEDHSLEHGCGYFEFLEERNIYLPIE